MNDRPTQLALRELRAHLARPATLAALAGVSAVLAIAGPFGTDTSLRAVPRLLYWAGLVAAAYALGYTVSAWMRARGGAWPPGWRLALTGTLTGCGTLLLVIAVNRAAFGDWTGVADLPGLLVPVFAIAFIVSAVAEVLGRHLAAGSNGADPGATPTPAAPPPILARLPLDRRGALLALSVEDHYVRVRTVRGEELVLMRLSDAMREVGDTPGAQVHRSHWVAFAAVAAARRERGRAVLTLTDGTEIPVSRARLAEVRAAGLLPG